MSEHDDAQAAGRTLRTTRTNGPTSTPAPGQRRAPSPWLPTQDRFTAGGQRRRNEGTADRLRAAVHLGRLLAAHTTAELEEAIGANARLRLTEAYEQLRAETRSPLELPEPVRQLRAARPDWWSQSEN
ncbi:hypothetical protein G3I40_05145 [Streptomyces sp. SID14478]|uniref:hypothetical protein n=1 Tax=Streptomyces sp. SID14478 TaxID=2706073 RepID=UPI0013DD0AB8|nr:hypothetical protein [Streptomyces sp. SID14478]NEB74621.1 hypothetical protein [Streptomyces sp. SID14478]